MKLEYVNALITGGSQGLGKAIADQFLREGANVCICARNESELAGARDELATKFPSRRVLAKSCDVSNEAQVNEMASMVLEKFASLRVLVLNAGIYGPMGPTESVDLEDWRRAVEINLFGVLLPCRALIPHFKKAGGGKIVVISGGGATNPLPNISSYAASKAAVIRLAETLAEELRPFQVDVNAIAPGALNTRLVKQVLEAGPEKVGPEFYAKNKKWAQGGAVPVEWGARLAVYLASLESNGITGKLISAQWDPWEKLHEFKDELAGDIYTLRRIVPKDRGKTWGEK